jgi:hypothetical protein
VRFSFSKFRQLLPNLCSCLQYHEVTSEEVTNEQKMDACTQTDLTGEGVEKMKEELAIQRMEQQSFEVPICKSIKKFRYHTGLPSVYIFLMILNQIEKFSAPFESKS